MAGALRSGVHSKVLWRCNGLVIVCVIALKPFHECDTEPGSQERILPIRFLSTPPARITENVNVRGPDIEPVIDAVIIVAQGLTVFGPSFRADCVRYLMDQGHIPRRGEANCLRKHRRITRTSDPMQPLTPPVVGRYVQTGNRACIILHLRDLLFQSHLPH